MSEAESGVLNFDSEVQKLADFKHWVQRDLLLYGQAGEQMTGFLQL